LEGGIAECRHVLKGRRGSATPPCISKGIVPAKRGAFAAEL